MGTGHATSRLFTIGDLGATLSATGTGAVNFSSTGNLGVENTNAAQNFTLTGSSTATNNLSSNIVDNGTGPTSVTKSGVGLWQLSGINTYSGNTTISGGTLQLGVNNVLPDGSGKGNVNITGSGVV